MAIIKKTTYGSINISNNAIAAVIADAVLECYGLIGIATRSKLGLITKKTNYAQGIIVTSTKAGVDIDIYCLISYGVKITEVLCEVQKKVKYVVEKTFEVKVNHVNTYATDLKKVD